MSSCRSSRISKKNTLQGDAGEIESSYINGMTRGGLLYPCAEIVSIEKTQYLVMRKLVSDENFIYSTVQRSVLVNVTLE